MVPSSLREMIFALGEQRPMVLFTPRDGGHLELFPASEWEAVQQKTAQKARAEKKPHLTRLLNAKAQPVTLEKEGNGRMLIPQGMADYFKPEGEVVFIGNNHKIELWSRVEYDDFLKAHEQDLDDLGDLLEY